MLEILVGRHSGAPDAPHGTLWFVLPAIAILLVPIVVLVKILRYVDDPTVTFSGDVASWWHVTSPPISGCLKIYIAWASSGRS